MNDFSARNQVAIVGYAQSPIVRRSSISLGGLALRTVREAIADAGLQLADVDGFITTPVFPSMGSHGAEDGTNFVTAYWLAQHLGVVPRYVASVQGSQLPSGVAAAVNTIFAGAADYVVVYRALHNPGGRYHQNLSADAQGDEQWANPQGHYGPIAAIAMCYNEYVQRYRVLDNALAPIVMEARKNGARLPWSYWSGKPLGLEEYLSAPFIDDPIRMYDCDIPVDGVAAFVLTSAERAKDRPHRPVYVSGYADVFPARRRLPLHWPYDDVMAVGEHCVNTMFKRAGMGIDEVELVQAYDGFAPLVFFWLEVLGMCPRGEAHRLVADGRIDSDRPGALPLLSGGGALGNGRMHGTPQMLECYLQLARRAGERQRDVSTAMACQGVPHVGGAVIYSASPN
jgi:acetyl-CoA acetyltransferase